MLAEGSEVWNLESEGCMTFIAVSARQSRIMIVLSENCSFQPLRFSLMWRRGTLSSPGHRWFASSAEAEVHAGASARSRATIVRPGRASENWSVRLLIAYSTMYCSIDLKFECTLCVRWLVFGHCIFSVSLASIAANTQ